MNAWQRLGVVLSIGWGIFTAIVISVAVAEGSFGSGVEDFVTAGAVLVVPIGSLWLIGWLGAWVARGFTLGPSVSGDWLNGPQHLILTVTAVVIICMTLCPPWLVRHEPIYTQDVKYAPTYAAGDYAPLWFPPERASHAYGARVDRTRLLVQYFAVIVGGGTLLLLTHRQHTR